MLARAYRPDFMPDQRQLKLSKPAAFSNPDVPSQARGTQIRVGFAGELHALRPRLALQFAHVQKSINFAGVAIPTWIEHQHIFVKHPFEQPGDLAAVFRIRQFCVGSPPKVVNPNFSQKMRDASMS